MAKTHYEILGVPKNAKTVEIRGAYRKLVLKHHPDRSKDPNAAAIFRTITEAFEVLGDPEARRRYDEHLDAEKRKAQQEAEKLKRQKEEEARRRKQEAAAAAVSAGVTYGHRNVRTTEPEVAVMMARLSAQFARQKIGDCERLAREIIAEDPSQALPYAVLGDIARSRGQLEDAARMYSFALQMQPQNALYLRRYEEILDRTNMQEGRNRTVRIQPQEKKLFSVFAMVCVTLLACMYMLLSPEKAELSQLSPISSWTVGLVMMLFLCGVSAGASMSIGNLIDKIDAYSHGRMSPAVTLGLVAIASFPAAVVLYGLIGLTQRAFNVTTTRLMLAVAAITGGLAVSASMSPASVSMQQVVLWGGNLVYVGALCGWTVTDSLKG